MVCWSPAEPAVYVAAVVENAKAIPLVKPIPSFVKKSVPTITCAPVGTRIETLGTADALGVVAVSCS